MRQLERQASRNSGNSSMPPSSDDLPGRAKPTPKRAKNSGRKPGKQQGAKGNAMPWVSAPDEWVPHRPQGRCGCGTDLADAHDVGIARSHQVHDLPEVRIKVSQHDVSRVRCPCSTEHVGSLPVEVSTAPSNGPNLKTLAVYLLVHQHVPVARCVQLIADLCGGAGPSDGFVHGMLARCARAVAEVVAVIKALITAAHVVGFDETTMRCGPAGAKKYVLSASTENATVYHLGGRDLDSFAKAGILPNPRHQKKPHINRTPTSKDHKTTCQAHQASSPQLMEMPAKRERVPPPFASCCHVMRFLRRWLFRKPERPRQQLSRR